MLVLNVASELEEDRSAVGVAGALLSLSFHIGMFSAILPVGTARVANFTMYLCAYADRQRCKQLLLPATTFGETLLVCEGDQTYIYESQRTEHLTASISMIISGNYVEMSDVGVIEMSNNAGITWVWAKDLSEEYWLYNLDTVSGKLKKMVMDGAPTILPTFFLFSVWPAERQVSGA